MDVLQNLSKSISAYCTCNCFVMGIRYIYPITLKVSIGVFMVYFHSSGTSPDSDTFNVGCKSVVFFDVPVIDFF